MKRIVIFLALMLCFAPPSSGAESNFKKTLNQFIVEALLNNPEIQEARKRIRVFREIPSQAGSLDDPILQFGLMNLPVDSLSFSQQAMTQKQLTLSQKLPFPGKLGLQVEIAEKNAAIVEKDLDERSNKVIRDIKQSYFELCYLLVAINITEQNKSLLSQFVTIAETKYSVGKGIQQDVIKAQVELSKIIDEIIRLNRLRDAEKARLNSLMNRLPQEPLKIPHGIVRSRFDFTLEELQALAEKTRPALQELKIAVEKNKTAKKLAEREYFPNFNIGARYGQRQDSAFAEHPDFISGYIGFNIPLWSKTKQSSKVREETHRIEMTRRAYRKVRNTIFLDLKKISDAETQGEKLLNLIETGILPQARQSLDSALAGYSVDKVNFLTLLDNQVTLFKWKLKFHRELTNYEKNLAELEYVVGKRLF